MALMNLVIVPDPRLRVQTQPVVTFDAALQKIIDDMIETMYAANGVGLAATQVGLDINLTVIDASSERNQPMVFINGEILETRDPEIMEEGCLSVPGHYDKVTRYRWVKAKALDRHGKPFTLETDGLLAHVIQHELDHLKGTLYIDQFSSLKRKRIQAKVKKTLKNQRSEKQT